MQDNTWKDIIAKLTKDFMDWGCPYSRKKLPEIASGYECTPLQFWNWLDDPETPRTEKGFLRVIGYAWRKYLEAEAEQLLLPVKAAKERPGRAAARKAA